MTWQIALNTFMTGLAGIGIWFIYDLVREFKSFRDATRTDVANLKVERVSFVNTVRQAELSIGHRCNDIQKIHNGFSLNVERSLGQINMELEKTRDLITAASKKAENFEQFLDKSLRLSKILHDRVRKTEHDLQALKVEVGEMMIFKGQKNGK